jgi:aspartate 1-decarboxylase
MVRERRTLLRSKLHGAVVTGANLQYVGSITIDAQLLEAADMVPYERVSVLNLANGARFDTYVVAGTRGSGDVVVNGAAARLVQLGDRIIVLAYAEVEGTSAELRAWRPRIVLLDGKNRPADRLEGAPEVTEGPLIFDPCSRE